MSHEPTIPSPSETTAGAMLEGTPLPSPNSVELLRTAASDYRLRFDRRDSHVAELFHENSKLSPHATHYYPNAAVALDRTRAWYFSTAYRVEEDTLVSVEADAGRLPIDELPHALMTMLGPFSREGRMSSLLYGLDLFALHEHWLLRVVPRAGFLWRDRRIADGDESRIRASIVEPNRVQRTGTLLFLAAAPWRYMMFIGPRGYRRLLMEAGELLARLRDAAVDTGLEAAVFPDFYDRCVDDLLLLDGVERTVVAIVTLDGQQL